MSGDASGRIPQAFIDDLLLRVDIVDLIDGHVPLKKSGSNFVARCPFHNEKTPSFSVSRKKQFYHCFGCGAGGNAISFLMDYNHLGFVEAIEDLAHFAGLEVPREKSAQFPTKQDQQTLNSIYHVLEQISVFFQQQLKNTSEGQKAIEYLKSRGISGEMARDFAIGYAPDKWDALLNKFDSQLLSKAGMLSQNDAGRMYDRFRGRLMFPIRDKRQRVIGFGGRVLNDSTPKYLNSPETDAFKKGREVYGLFELLKKQSKPQRILIVEGYMDVIALNQAGLPNTVATLGTATSRAHLELLFRFTSELVFCFDGDNAGRQAAWRAMEAVFPCLSGRRLVKFLMLPQHEDPDSLIRKLGLEKFNGMLVNAEDLSDYFFKQLSENLNLESVDGKVRLMEEASTYLESMPSGIAKDVLLQYFEQKTQFARVEIHRNTETKPGLKRTPLRVVIALLMQNPELLSELEKLDIEWGVCSFSGKEMLLDLIQTIVTKQPSNAGVLLELYRHSEHADMMQKLARLPVAPALQQDYNELAEFLGALKRVVEHGKRQYQEELIENKLRKKQ